MHNLFSGQFATYSNARKVKTSRNKCESKMIAYKIIMYFFKLQKLTFGSPLKFNNNR